MPLPLPAKAGSLRGMKLMKRAIVGVCGYATVGKDELCKALGFARCAFADALKADLAPVLAKLPPHEKSQIRPLLVEYGRTARRIDPDYWVKRLVVPEGDVVCCDLRYRNEVQHVYSIGGIVIRLHRPGVVAANEEEDRTIREIDLLYPNLPQIENDGTPRDMAEKVRGILYAQARPLCG